MTKSDKSDEVARIAKSDKSDKVTKSDGIGQKSRNRARDQPREAQEAQKVTKVVIPGLLLTKSDEK